MFRFIPQQIPDRVYLIGCGGTGSRLAPLLTQFLASITRENNPQGFLESPKVFFIDPDSVESKNLTRQNFVQSDLGKPKAVVLANRYGKAFNVRTYAITERVNSSPSRFLDVIGRVSGEDSDATSTFGSCLVIICTDSASSRRDILSCFGGVNFGGLGRQPFVIDSGNEDTFGQVTFFNAGVAYDGRDTVNRFKASIPELCPVQVDVDAIPMDVRRYQSMEDRVGTGSCADLDQTLAINAMMATTIMSVVQGYYYGMPFTYNTVSLSMDGGNQTLYNTAKNFADRLMTDEYELRLPITTWPMPISWTTYSIVQDAAVNGEPAPATIVGRIVIEADPDYDSMTVVETSGFTPTDEVRDRLNDVLSGYDHMYGEDLPLESFTAEVRRALGLTVEVEVRFLS